MTELPSEFGLKIADIGGMIIQLIITVIGCVILFLAIQLYLVAYLNFGITSTVMNLYVIALAYYDNSTIDVLAAVTAYIDIFETILSKTEFEQNILIGIAKPSEILALIVVLLSLAAAIARIREAFTKNTPADTVSISDADL
jgi:hypothetical protein